MTTVKVKVTMDEWCGWKSRQEKGDKTWEKEFVDKYVDEAWFCGYGYYGATMYKAQPGLVFAQKGSTCD